MVLPSIYIFWMNFYLLLWLVVVVASSCVYFFLFVPTITIIFLVCYLVLFLIYGVCYNICKMNTYILHMSSVFIFVKIKSDFVSLTLILYIFFFYFLLKSLRCYYLMISSHCAKEITERQATFFLQVIFLYIFFPETRNLASRRDIFVIEMNDKKKKINTLMMMIIMKW